VLTNRESSGAPVLSLLDGSVAWAFPPGEQTSCMEIVASDGRFSTMLCHVMLNRAYKRGEKVNRGQQLGTVAAPGEVGNNGMAHVHLELHRASGPVPFSPPDGLLLDGVDLPFTGETNENAGVTLRSTNALVAQPAQDLTAPPPVVSNPGGTRCAPGVSPRFALGFADPNGSGDMHQLTTSGLAFWRESTNMPTFTNGSQHWGRTAAGWVEWTGTSIDPPTA
jgi:hypothetical protein